MAEPRSVSPDPETKLDHDHFTSSAYRMADDDKVFADCALTWTNMIAKADASCDPVSVDEDSLVEEHIDGIQGLQSKPIHPRKSNPVETAVSEVDAAAMVVTPGGIVVSANDEAKRRFRAIQGLENDFDWLNPVSLLDFEAVRSGALDLTNQKSTIVRTCDEGDLRGVAEVYTLPTENSGKHCIVIRALETQWSTEVDAVLENAFGMTIAEREISRALYETRDTSQVARIRKTKPQTIRTQIRSILRKTETTSQVDLVHLIGLLNARASHRRLISQVARRDC